MRDMRLTGLVALFGSMLSGCVLDRALDGPSIADYDASAYGDIGDPVLGDARLVSDVGEPPDGGEDGAPSGPESDDLGRAIPPDADAPEPPPLPGCDDGIDNDGDGAADTLDVDCTDGDDLTEQGNARAPACFNGVDDDGDGWADFPLDPGCAGAGDIREADPAEVVACANGIDDDGDGEADYPHDPGCTGRGDGDETTRDPPPACGNGVDDDDNGEVDFPDDLGCTSAADLSESSPCGAVEPINLTAHLAHNEAYDGTLSGLDGHLSGLCGGRAGGEMVFVFDVDRLMESVTFSTLHPETQAPTVVYARETCTAIEDLACDRGNADAPGAAVTVHRPPLGPLYLVVDTGSPAAVGAFRLTTEVEYPPQCRDGLDNDLDGTTDATDFGCADLEDDDETDPDELPICGNRVDDDMDGTTDYPNDADCVTAGFHREASPCTLGIPSAVAGQRGGRFDFAAAPGAVSAAQGRCVRDIGPEAVVVLTLDAPSRVEIDVNINGTRTPASIYVRTACEAIGSEVGCRSGDADLGTLLFDHLERGVYHVMVEHPENGDTNFTVEVAVRSNIRECNDLIDNDNDGQVDLNDIGCVEGLDDSEVDPPALPACGDGVDNDGDLRIDYPADDDCTAAGDDREAPMCRFTNNVIEIPPRGGVFPYSTRGQPSAGRGRCGGGGPQAVAVLTVNRVSAVTFSTEAIGYDTLIHLRTRCDDPNSEIACNDDFGGLASRISVPRLQPGTYFLMLDGYLGNSGAATVRVTVQEVGDPL